MKTPRPSPAHSCLPPNAGSSLSRSEEQERLWGCRWNRRCRSHRPDVPASVRSPPPADSFPHIHSTAPLALHRHRSHAASPATLPTVPAIGSASAPPPLRCPRSCSATAPWDTPGPAAHTLLPPSALQVTPPPSPRSAPRRSLPAPPPSLPALANNVPAGSLAGSTLRNSATFLRTPPLSSSVSSPPAPRSVPARNDGLDTLSPLRSTPLIAVRVLLLEVLPAYVPLSSVLPPTPSPDSAARTPCIRTPAPLPLPPPPAPLSGTLLLPDHPPTV